MGLFNFSKPAASDDDRPPGKRTAAPADPVEKVRTRTRQRLIGAVVLLTIAVIGFPLLFESQPRPIPIDIPIDIPKPDSVPALVLPPPSREAAAPTPGAAASGMVETESPPAAVPDAAPDAAPDAPPEAAPAAPAASVAAVPSAAASPAVSAGKAAVAAVAPSTEAAPAPASAADGAPRFVVQVGAFTDPAAVRDVRAKMDKLGLKTYTQVADTTAGKRTRVRLGPFATRAEADRVRARAKDAGIAAVVLSL